LPADFFPFFSLTGPNLANTLSQLSGEVATGPPAVSNQMMTEFLALMLDPYRDGTAGGAMVPFAPERASVLPPEAALAYASVLKAPVKAPVDVQRWTAWGAAFGGTNRTDGDPVIGSNNVAAHNEAYAAGVNYRFSPDTIAGFSLAGGGTGWNLAQGFGTGRSDAFLAGAFGKTFFGPAYVGGALAFADHWFTTNRTALGDQLRANFNGQAYAGRLEAGDRFAVLLGTLLIGVTPYAALQAEWLHTPAYGEVDLTGGGFGLNYAAMDAHDTRGELGARFDDLTMFGPMPMMLRSRLAWAHDWVSNPTIGAAFQALPGAFFTVNGAAPPKDSFISTSSVELALSSRWSLTGKFDSELAKGSQTYAGTGTVRYRW
jgi:outer membrane autotransporter protein